MHQLRWVIWLAFLPATLLGDGLYLGVEEEEIKATIRDCYNLSAQAEPRLESIVESAPESPIGYFLKSSHLFWLSEYAGVDGGFRDDYERVAEEALRVARSYAREHPDDLRGRFVLGMTELSLARFHIEEGHWFRAFFKATSGLRRIREVLKEDPQFHDAKMPLGLANCFLEKAPAYLKPFAFLMRFDGDMETGLQQLRDARSKGFLSRYESAYYLVAVHWELREDLKSARVQLEELATEFPGNVNFQRLLSNLDLAENNTKPAIARYERLLLDDWVARLPSVEVETCLKLGQDALNRNELSKCLEYGRRAELASASRRSLEEERAWAILMQGEALRRQRRFDEALAKLNRIEKSHNKEAHTIAARILDEVRAERSEPI